MTKDTPCAHTHTTHKFGGAVVCDDCSLIVRYWSKPTPIVTASRNDDGTFTVSDPTFPVTDAS